MSALIKDRDTSARRIVRQLTSAVRPKAAHAPAADPVDLERLSLKAQIDTLKDELQARNDDIASLRAELVQAGLEGVAQGREEGRAQARDDHEAALATLDAGVAKALDEFNLAIESLERLAPTMVSVCLARLMDEPSGYEQLLTSMLKKQLQGLSAEALVRVEVSSADFPEQAHIHRLIDGTGRSDVAVETSSDLIAGDCRIKLVLGSLEVGIGQQWQSLRQLLDQFAAADPPP